MLKKFYFYLVGLFLFLFTMFHIITGSLQNDEEGLISQESLI